MIRIAQQKDIPVLSEIWSQAFADSKSYIDFFMKKRFSSCVSLVNETQERISSALYLLPGELMIEGNAHKAVYLYAAATIPEDRGKGYMSALLKQAEQTAAERGAEFIALVPGDEKLFDFYSKRGYSTAFSVREITMNKEKINSAENVGYRFSYGILPDFGALYSLRSKVLGDTVYFSWSEDALKYA